MTSVPVGWNGVGTNDAGNFEQLRRFKELNPEVNLGFALGGWTLSDEFSTAYATQEGRDKFVSETVRIFETYDFFNVVDFDWEYPGGGGKAGNAVSASDGANFELVLRICAPPSMIFRPAPGVTLRCRLPRLVAKRSWPTSTFQALTPTSTSTT